MKISEPPRSRHFSLVNVEKIRPGISKKKDVLGILGEPDEHLDLTQVTYQKSDSDCWSYLEEPYKAEDRVSVEFPPNSDIVLSVGWAVREGEPEQSLEVAKAHFPSGTFERQKMPDLNPHTAETRVFYKEKQLGGLIIYESVKHRVESIAWMQPTELVKATALENFVYPEVCIQGHCAHSSPEIERKLSGE